MIQKLTLLGLKLFLKHKFNCLELELIRLKDDTSRNCVAQSLQPKRRDNSHVSPLFDLFLRRLYEATDRPKTLTSADVGPQRQELSKDCFVGSNQVDTIVGLLLAGEAIQPLSFKRQ